MASAHFEKDAIGGAGCHFWHTRGPSGLPAAPCELHQLLTATWTSVIWAVAEWLMMQPEFPPPALSPKIFAAYPDTLKLSEEAKIGGLGYLTWAMVLKGVE